MGHEAYHLRVRSAYRRARAVRDVAHNLVEETLPVFRTEKSLSELGELLADREKLLTFLRERQKIYAKPQVVGQDVLGDENIGERGVQAAARRLVRMANPGAGSPEERAQRAQRNLRKLFRAPEEHGALTEFATSTGKSDTGRGDSPSGTLTSLLGRDAYGVLHHSLSDRRISRMVSELGWTSETAIEAQRVAEYAGILPSAWGRSGLHHIHAADMADIAAAIPAIAALDDAHVFASGHQTKVRQWLEIAAHQSDHPDILAHFTAEVVGRLSPLQLTGIRNLIEQAGQHGNVVLGAARLGHLTAMRPSEMMAAHLTIAAGEASFDAAIGFIAPVAVGESRPPVPPDVVAVLAPLRHRDVRSGFHLAWSHADPQTRVRLSRMMLSPRLGNEALNAVEQIWQVPEGCRTAYVRWLGSRGVSLTAENPAGRDRESRLVHMWVAASRLTEDPDGAERLMHDAQMLMAATIDGRSSVSVARSAQALFAALRLGGENAERARGGVQQWNAGEVYVLGRSGQPEYGYEVLAVDRDRRTVVLRHKQNGTYTEMSWKEPRYEENGVTLGVLTPLETEIYASRRAAFAVPARDALDAIRLRAARVSREHEWCIVHHFNSLPEFDPVVGHDGNGAPETTAILKAVELQHEVDRNLPMVRLTHSYAERVPADVDRLFAPEGPNHAALRQATGADYHFVPVVTRDLFGSPVASLTPLAELAHLRRLVTHGYPVAVVVAAQDGETHTIVATRYRQGPESGEPEVYVYDSRVTGEAPNGHWVFLGELHNYYVGDDAASIVGLFAPDNPRVSTAQHPAGVEAERLAQYNAALGEIRRSDADEVRAFHDAGHDGALPAGEQDSTMRRIYERGRERLAQAGVRTYTEFVHAVTMPSYCAGYRTEPAEVLLQGGARPVGAVPSYGERD